MKTKTKRIIGLVFAVLLAAVLLVVGGMAYLDTVADGVATEGHQG